MSKKSFRAFADSAIFKPLGMTNTNVHDSHQMLVKNRSYSYASSPEREFRLTPTVTDQFVGNQWWFRGVQFQRNAQGAIAGFTITGGRVRYLRFVKRA